MGSNEKRSGNNRRASKERRSGTDTRSEKAGDRRSESIGDRAGIEDLNRATFRRHLIRSNDRLSRQRTKKIPDKKPRTPRWPMLPLKAEGEGKTRCEALWRR
jgi:hypothetical protein